MIKLIASDMDGTLLDEQKRIPEGFFSAVKQLKKNNITFVAASGRSYPKMEADFKQALEDIYFICDNGALIMYQGKMLHTDCLDSTAVKEVICTCQNLSDVLLVLCGTEGAWHLPCPPQFKEHLESYYIRDHVVEDLLSVEDGIFKIAICDLQGSANHSYPLLNQVFGRDYHVVVSGEIWMDVMQNGVNKGSAMKIIQQLVGAEPENSMAFGDFYNDVEMLRLAKYSYVMENANLDMRQYGNYLAPGNQENGVMRVITSEVLSKL